jgi:hypothetical protein
MLQRMHGILFVLLGVVSLVDGRRIALEARETANFDAIGPDRYLLALGAALFAAGLWRLFARHDPLTEPRAAVGTGPAGAKWTLVATLAMLAGFAALTPALGFSLAALLFLTAEFALLSGWPWWKSVAAGAVGALALHAAFIWLADVPFPKGYIWDALSQDSRPAGFLLARISAG